MNSHDSGQYVVIFVLSELERLQEILDRWVEAGVTGVTILESSGGLRIRERLRMDDVPLFPSINSLLDAGQGELIVKTIFSVVPDIQTAEKVIAATEAVIGDLSTPHKGIIFVMPAILVRGLNPRK